MGGKNPCEGPSLLASVPYLRNLPRLRKGRGDISWKGVFVVWTAVWGASFENDEGGGKRSSRRVCDKDDSTNGRTLLPSLPFFASDRGELGYLRDHLSRLPARNDAIIAPWLRSKIIDGSYYIVAGMELWGEELRRVEIREIIEPLLFLKKKNWKFDTTIDLNFSFYD